MHPYITLLKGRSLEWFVSFSFFIRTLWTMFFFFIILFVSPVCMIEVHAPFSFRTPSSQATLKAKIITEIKNSIALHAVYCRLNWVLKTNRAGRDWKMEKNLRLKMEKRTKQIKIHLRFWYEGVWQRSQSCNTMHFKIWVIIETKASEAEIKHTLTVYFLNFVKGPVSQPTCLPRTLGDASTSSFKLFNYSNDYFLSEHKTTTGLLQRSKISNDNVKSYINLAILQGTDSCSDILQAKQVSWIFALDFHLCETIKGVQHW